VRLVCKLTEFDGTELVTLHSALDASVTIPLNDARTASVTLSVYDPAVAYVRPLHRLLKVFWGDWLVFWGPILQPEYALSDPGSSTVKVNAHDPTLYWKKQFHRYGDAAVDIGYSLDGMGIFTCATSAYPSYDARLRGVPHPGIYFGEDTSIRQLPKPDNIEKPEAGDGLWTRATRGQNIDETIKGIQSAATGPDWDLRPIDAEHPGVLRTWTPGYYAELNIYSRRYVDRLDTVLLTKGTGTDNCESFNWTPDGDQVVNYATVVAQGGEKDSTDEDHRQLVHDESSWQDYGIMQRWEAAQNDQASAEYLHEIGVALVTNYAEPPNVIAATLKDSAPQYLTHFTVGDYISAQAKQGYAHSGRLSCRVASVTLDDDGKMGKTTADLAQLTGTSFSDNDPNT
jgi:hypothetical protein